METFELQAGLHHISLGSCFFEFVFNVNPRLINPWLINRGVSPLSGEENHFGGTHTPNNGKGLLILGQH